MAEFPESGLVRKTFTIRQMDLPPDVKLTRRSMLRWFALSFGLISEKESRDTVLNVLDALFSFLLEKHRAPSTKEIQKFISEKFQKRVSEKLLRYHLNKMIELGLIVRKKNKYELNHAPEGERGNISESFSYWIKMPINNSIENISSVLEQLKQSYGK